MKILVIDDESHILNVARSYLEAEAYTVLCAEDGATGLQAFRRHRPDFVILDIMLPAIDGLEVLQHIRRESDAFVMLLTARDDENDRIVGLTVGADDYLTKPFSPREMVARVKAIWRRGRKPTTETLFIVRDLRIDVERHEVWRGDDRIDLTALEFQIIIALARYPGLVMSRTQLIERIWGHDYFGDHRIIDTHIGRIRHKLEPDPDQPHYIVTVRGVGYKLEEGGR